MTIHYPLPLGKLRDENWVSIPTGPGVYWWYFPEDALDALKINSVCNTGDLRFRHSDGKVCLYHGIANNLAQRIAWHADQRLSLSNLRSGWISTLRLTLLALNDFDYNAGDTNINEYFNTLSVFWKETGTREAAETIERSELSGEYRYPLNIQGNRHKELSSCLRLIKGKRKDYKHKFAVAESQSSLKKY